MSPGDALGSDVFRIYVAIAAGLLLLSGCVLTYLTRVLRRDVSGVRATWRSWLVMAPLALGAVVAGRATVIAGIFVLAILGFKEYARATGLYRDWWMTGAVYVAIAALCAVTLVDHPRVLDPTPGWYGMFMALPVYAIGFLLLVPILRNRTEGMLQALALAILGFVYIGWMFGHLAFLANSRYALGYLLYLVFAVEIGDVAAFTFGRLFGRHPFRSRISPKKTWEGALGSLAVSLALPWALRFSFPHFGTRELLLTGLLVGVGGQLGDLAISVIKRDIGIKDMGAALPGHGGILDRIDSLIFTAPFFFHMTRWFYGL